MSSPGPAYAFDDAPGYSERRFARLPAVAAARLAAGAPSPALAAPLGSEAHEQELADAALGQLRASGADFGDLRLGRDLARHVMTSDDNITGHHQAASEGMGVRALVRGYWGFAATSDLTVPGVRACAARAVQMARAVAAVSPADQALPLARFAAEPAHRAVFDTAVGICPFAAALPELASPLTEAARVGLGRPGILRVAGLAAVYGRRRVFASTDGAYIVTTHAVVDSWQRFIAVANGTSAYRTVVGTGLAGGLEHLHAVDYPGQAASAAADALAKCGAAKPEPGRYTLILDGHNLALTMHESVGHPTELDRVLGYELGFAGGSFAGLDKLGTFRYGSPLVNFTANNRLRYGGATVGFDDEGVACQSFPVIRDGVLVGYGTNRETAHLIGAARANGTCRATGWADPPIVRIPNLYLEPGRAPLSLAALIEATDDGILMLGRDSFSIDQMRVNFQFGADMSYRIRGGRLAEPLRDVIYQSLTPDFWGALDAVCDASEWQMHGVFNCGKGQPVQAAKMMHGAAPARFRNVRVGY